MRLIERANVPANGASPARFNVTGNVIIYGSGPRVIRIEFIDNTKEEHSFLLQRGDKFTLPAGRKFEEILAFNLDPVDSRILLQAGSGDIRTTKGGITANAPPYAAGFGYYLGPVAATYTVIGLRNPATSGVVAEVTLIEGAPTTTQGHTLMLGDVDFSTAGLTASQVTVGSPYYNDRSLGVSNCAIDFYFGVTQPNFGAGVRHFYSLGGGPTFFPYTLEMDDDPLVIRPGQYAAVVGTDATGAAANQALAARFEFTERAA